MTRDRVTPGVSISHARHRRTDLHGRRGARPGPAPGPHALLGLQQTVGNRAVGDLVAAVQRADDMAASAAPELHNARFAGDRVLTGILRGEIAALSARHNGRRRAVGKVQHALKDSGFDLPLHRVDGAYGSETEDAVEEFRQVQGLARGRLMDGSTLERLDQVAPPPGRSNEHTVDYERLLADSRLTVTAAIGFSDEHAWRRSERGRWEETSTPVEELEAQRFRDWLEGQGFALELLGLDRVEHWKKTHAFTWTDAAGTAQTRQADVWVRLITPGEGAARAFRQGLADDEVAMYSGHARYGSGPDFDAKRSPAENFRVGIDAAMAAAGRRTNVEEARRHGVAIDEENDLTEMVNSGDFDRERYRVLFLNACTSMAYLDELRSEVGGQRNLDVVGTRRPSAFSIEEAKISAAEIQVFLAGVLAGSTVQDIVTALDQSQIDRFGRHVVDRRGLFTMSGVGDNPVSAASP